MPLRPGKSREIVSSNIKELVKSGMKPKRAIAASLAEARRHKMAEGGEVEMEGSPEDLHEESAMREQAQGSHDSAHDEGEAGEPIYPIQSDAEGLSMSVQDVEELMSALQSKKYAANQNSHDFNPDDPMGGQKMSRGGQIEDKDAMHASVGGKPDLDFIDDGDGESMSVEAASKGHGGPDEHSLNPDAGAVMPSGLSEEAHRALLAKKKARRYGQFNPR